MKYGGATVTSNRKVVTLTITFLLIIAFTILLVNGCSQKPQVTSKQANQAKEKGLELYRSGKWDESIKQLQTAVQGKPKDLQIRYQLAYAYNQKKDYDNAYSAYEEVLKIDPKSADAHYGMGTIFVQKKDLDKAITEFETAAQMNPSFTSVRVDLAKAYESTKEYKKAIKIYDELDKIIASDPYFKSRIHSSKASLLEKLGNLKQARAEYERALALDKNNIDAKKALKK